jgi:hypothetical protein
MKDFEKLKEHIKKNITLGVLLRNEDRITYDLDEEQIHCPFHGVDNKKSARYYKTTDTMYCWVCKKKWDIFSYVSQKSSIGIKDSFRYLVEKYRIDISSVPEQMEVFVQGITGPNKIVIDRKKVFLMQLHDYIFNMKNKVALEKYKKLVFSYMLIRYSVSDDKFMEACNKFNEALMKITKEINNGTR